MAVFEALDDMPDWARLPLGDGWVQFGTWLRVLRDYLDEGRWAKTEYLRNAYGQLTVPGGWSLQRVVFHGQVTEVDAASTGRRDHGPPVQRYRACWGLPLFADTSRQRAHATIGQWDSGRAAYAMCFMNEVWSREQRAWHQCARHSVCVAGRGAGASAGHPTVVSGYGCAPRDPTPENLADVADRLVAIAERVAVEVRMEELLNQPEVEAILDVGRERQP